MAIDWVEATLVERVEWTRGLVSLVFDAAIDPFEPGQFVNLGMDIEGEPDQRAYSLASVPGSPPELFVTRVAGGAFTTALLGLAPGDGVRIQRRAAGFFVLSEMPDAERLWMIATGTGLGPYISMLRAGAVFERFERVLLVHGVRDEDHLAYRDELAAIGRAHGGRLGYVPAISRSPDAEDAIHGRVTDALKGGALEAAAGLSLDAESSHVMLCGNPAMVSDMIALLGERGMVKHRRRKPGHITTERYW